MSRQKCSIDREAVRRLAEEGLSLREIAASLGIARSTFYAAMKSDLDISDTIRGGRATLVKECVGIVLKAARSGEKDCYKAAVVLLEKYSDTFRDVDEDNALCALSFNFD